MKNKTNKVQIECINDPELSSVPSSAHFIETCSKSKVKNLGGWLQILDDDSLSYITELFSPIQETIPDGMALPVCDVVSLCLLIKEWESGEKFYAKDAWDFALPMIPRLRRALLLESIRRNGLIEILNVSILDDNFDIRVNPTEDIDDMLSKWIENGLNKNELLKIEEAAFEDDEQYED